VTNSGSASPLQVVRGYPLARNDPESHGLTPSMPSSGCIRGVLHLPQWISLWAVVLLVPFNAHADPAPPIAADPERQAEVSERGAQVMPFKLSATTHVFTKTSAGALQKVIVKDPNDTAQIGLIRRHLSDIADGFSRRDFSGPTEVHGAQMPGLADLKKAKPAEISVRYQDLAEGAQIEYSAQKANLIEALHKWVDAQLSDHGPDAHEGHMQHHDHAVDQ
jgi:hypothetical protein